MPGPAPTFNRAFCQPEYDTFRTAPDAAEVLRLRAELSGHAIEALKPAVDLRYGPRAKQTLDVFAPSEASRGVMVFFHGGYWQRMDKRDVSFLAVPFVQRGFSFVNVNYSLAPEVDLDAIVAQARQACRWAWLEAARHGGDPRNIHVSGSSAGGHLAMMAAATDWTALDPSLPPDLLKGGCGLSGLYELEPLLHTSVNDAVRMDEATARRNSPVRLQPHLAGPLLLAVGALESSEFHRQTRDLAQAWSSLSPRVMTVPRRHHFDILLEFGDPASELSQATLQAMERSEAR